MANLKVCQERLLENLGHSPKRLGVPVLKACRKMEGEAFLFSVITKLSGSEMYACQFWVCIHYAT